MHLPCLRQPSTCRCCHFSRRVANPSRNLACSWITTHYLLVSCGALLIIYLFRLYLPVVPLTRKSHLSKFLLTRSPYGGACSCNAPFKSVLPLIFGLQCSAAGRRGIHLSCFRQLSGCWHCCLPLNVSPTRPTHGLVCSRKALPYLLHCFHAAQRVRALNQLHVYRY